MTVMAAAVRGPPGRPSSACCGRARSPSSARRRRPVRLGKPARQSRALRLSAATSTWSAPPAAEINGRPCVNSTPTCRRASIARCWRSRAPAFSMRSQAAPRAASAASSSIAAGFAEAGPEGQRTAGGDRAHRPRPRHGDLGAELSRPHQLCRRHSVDVQHLRAGAARRAARRRHRVAKRRHGDRAARRAASARYRDLATRSRPATRRSTDRGFPRLSDRRSNRPTSSLMMVEQFRASAALPCGGAQGARGRQADRAAASRPQRRGALVRADPYRRHERRLRGHAHAGARMPASRLVDTLEELLDLGELMIRWPSPPRGGTAVISDSGAFKAMVLDFCEGSDLDVPEPTGATRDSARRAGAGSRSCRPIRSTSRRSRWSIPISIARRCSRSSTTTATAAWCSPWC